MHLLVAPTGDDVRAPSEADIRARLRQICFAPKSKDKLADGRNAALRIDPKLANALYGRGLAKLRRGETSSGAEDIAAAKALIDIAEEFARYGVR
jgi:hypothetical protein